MSHLSGTYENIDLSKFKPKEHFKEYHFFEKYDEGKDYPDGTFIKDFGQGEHNYEYCLYTLNSTEKYIVAKEILSVEENAELSPYCRCEYHKSYWFNPLKYLICPCCVGCINSMFPEQYVINNTRKYKEKMNPKQKSVIK